MLARRLSLLLSITYSSGNRKATFNTEPKAYPVGLFSGKSI